MRRYKYDAALSFAGSERPLASFLASLLTNNGVRVYYDDFERWNHLGQNLIEELSDIYENQCRFCIVLISQQYLERAFTSLEIQSALDRLILAQDRGYILPIRVDDSWIKGLSRATCFVDLRKQSLVAAGEMLVRKVIGRLPKDGLHVPVEPELADIYVSDEGAQKKLHGVYSIKNSFRELKSCLLAGSREAADWVSRSTIYHYKYLKQHALFSERAALRELLFADRLIALRLRVEIPSELLLDMDEREVFSWGVRNGLVNKDGVAREDIRSVVLLSDHLASATLVRDERRGPAAFSRIRFLLEDGRWRLDLKDTLVHANLYFEGVHETWDPEAEDSYLLEALSRLSGRRIAESVWVPPYTA